jgi:hypothetical protein
MPLKIKKRKKQSIVEKSARKKQSTELARTRRAMHKAGAPPIEYMTWEGQDKIASEIEEKRRKTRKNLKPFAKTVNKRIAKFAKEDHLVREVNKRTAKKKY